MRSFLAGILVTVGVLAVVGQLALPAYFESRVEDRMEERGGDAKVSIGAFPALTLVAGRGETFEARGSGLEFDIEARREQPFDRLDGFEQVDVDMEDLEVGPVAVSRFELARDGRGEDYAMTMRGDIEPRELARALGSAAGGPLGGLLGSLATGMFPDAGATQVPVDLQASVRSDDGRTDVTAARGSIAGVPAGPLAEIVLGAVLKQL
jgi:hypothetical protein